MNPMIRGRVRLNGQASVQNNRILLTTEEVYGNCSMYIQKTDFKHVAPKQHAVQVGAKLSSELKAFIEQAHTFFIASAHPTGKADVSHRGGQAGFVSVNGNEIRFPDYVGNNMFNTLGNIESNPNVGLLFIDLETGDSLQLSGKAKILWDEADYKTLKGAKRATSVTVESFRFQKQALQLRGKVLEFSSHNP